MSSQTKSFVSPRQFAIATGVFAGGYLATISCALFLLGTVPGSWQAAGVAAAFLAAGAYLRPRAALAVLKPFASLKLTVVLLAASILVVFAGTLAQREQGTWQAVEHYFRVWWAFIPLKNVVPFVAVDKFPSWAVFLFPGGKTIVVVMMVNLLAAHAVRFKFVPGDLLLLPLLAASGWAVYQTQETPTVLLVVACCVTGAAATALTIWLHAKRAGVIVIHFSLILLLVGELVAGALQDEGLMPIVEGSSTNYVQDVRDAELAVIDTATPDPTRDRQVVVSAKRLERGGELSLPNVAVKLKVDEFAWNADVLGPAQAQAANRPVATAGTAKGLGMQPKPRAAGVKGEENDAPVAFVTATAADGRPLGSFLLPAVQKDPQPIPGTPYLLQVRYTRTYKPYTVALKHVAHDTYVGTTMASNYHSEVRLTDPSAGVDREVTIRMNEPMRHAGETFYQSGVPAPDTTVLQVVKNPGWLVPYVACGLGAAGLLAHFGIHLVSFLGKRARGGVV
ncbi:MAG TPA: cytochrome c biogenesis protein ResB, partial [Humisphaera sp.]